MIGAALFYGDGVITPGDLGAERGRRPQGRDAGVRALRPADHASSCWSALFLIQRRGTGMVGEFFGPIMAVWFVVLALSRRAPRSRGIPAILLRAQSRATASHFLLADPLRGFILLGAVVLAVTGAEALYADMGHFGGQPIRRAWLYFVFPGAAAELFRPGRAAAARAAARWRIRSICWRRTGRCFRWWSWRRRRP